MGRGVSELIAAAHVYTIKRFGPDRIVGFSPIPAMSMVSYAAGTRFLSLIGGVIPSFYDWYADLPPASPQVFGDQTDVPESGDWWNAAYLIIWGTNLSTTRTPDTHFMVEARYRGQKVVVVSPDYAEHTKFADDWLAVRPGTDAALAMAMGHVILTECYVRRPVPSFVDDATRFTDLPFLVTLRERGDAYVPDRFLSASDTGDRSEHAEWKPTMFDAGTGHVAVPNGSIGFRHGEEGAGGRPSPGGHRRRGGVRCTARVAPSGGTGARPALDRARMIVGSPLPPVSARPTFRKIESPPDPHGGAEPIGCSWDARTGTMRRMPISPEDDGCRRLRTWNVILRPVRPCATL